MAGLPEEKYPIPFVAPGSMKTEYSVIIGGDNFGCGSSREHAPVCLGAAGSQVVVAQSFARIFFRNCVATCDSWEGMRVLPVSSTRGNLA